MCLLISQFTGNKHLVANKRETFVLHCYKLDFLCINDLYFNVFNLHFTFWICTVDRSCKIGATTVMWP